MELLRNEYETYGWTQKEVILWSLQVDKKERSHFRRREPKCQATVLGLEYQELSD